MLPYVPPDQSDSDAANGIALVVVSYLMGGLGLVLGLARLSSGGATLGWYGLALSGAAVIWLNYRWVKTGRRFGYLVLLLVGLIVELLFGGGLIT